MKHKYEKAIKIYLEDVGENYEPDDDLIPNWVFEVEEEGVEEMPDLGTQSIADEEDPVVQRLLKELKEAKKKGKTPTKSTQEAV